MTHLENQVIRKLSAKISGFERELEQLSLDKYPDNFDVKVDAVELLSKLIDWRLTLEDLGRQPITAATYSYELSINKND